MDHKYEMSINAICVGKFILLNEQILASTISLSWCSCNQVPSRVHVEGFDVLFWPRHDTASSSWHDVLQFLLFPHIKAKSRMRAKPPIAEEGSS